MTRSIVDVPGKIPAVVGWPARQVRARFDDQAITLYQAFRPDIADAAIQAGTFVAPFGMGRMTWVKPSFRWMMYRSGWATKPGQERVLAVHMTRAGFEEVLAEACLSSYDDRVYRDRDEWVERKRATRVRVQWDPERDMDSAPLSWRTIQIGMAGPVVRRYVGEWIEAITDVTPLAHQAAQLVAAGDRERALALLPTEVPYPLPASTAALIGAE